MRTTVVLFTRDLRVHDNPALHAACAGSGLVVPLFVADPTIAPPANRDRFLLESLADLRASLRARGGDLIVRRGDPVTEAVRLARRVGAEEIAVAADVSAYAANRERRLSAACEGERIGLRLHDSVTVVAPGALRPTGGGGHYRVFTPYWRAWSASRWRTVLPAPRRITLPESVRAGGIRSGTLAPARRGESPGLSPGGETAALARLEAWRRRVGEYADHHDDLPADHTSRLSPYLHFGCLSAVSVAAAVGQGESSAEFVRQLCWRDFYHQVLADFPDLTHVAYRRNTIERWIDAPELLDAWRYGETGVPIVDAGMRQLMAEGFMHNRARLITASYLTKDLRLDWREGADWFARWLVDADVANNWGNWQWVAGTGNDTRPRRRFNVTRQARRFDHDGTYVRRWLSGPA